MESKAGNATTLRLGDVAAIRCGDKGNTSLIAVHPHANTDVAWLKHVLQPDAIGRVFDVPAENVTVHAPTALGSIIIVVRDRLYGGVTRSTTTDPHGKGYSYHLFEMEIPQQR